MSVILPTTAFDPAKTIVPKKTYLVLTPTIAGTPAAAVTLPGKVANFEQSFEVAKRDVPTGTDGALMPDRKSIKGLTQSIKFEVEDVKSMVGAFASTTSIDGYFTKGTAELFVADPEDATGKVAVHSNVFKASWTTDGLSMTHGEVTKATITVEAMEKVVLTPDVAVT